MEYPFIKGIEGFPEIIPVVKLEHETKNFGGIWHTDTAYLDTPPMATMLIARKVLRYGGDTLFANTYLAYETLSDGMKRMLEGMIAVNHSAKADATRTREDRIRDGGKPEARRNSSASIRWCVHIRKRGRKALYVNIGHTVRFKDMTEDESAPILELSVPAPNAPRIHLPLQLARRFNGVRDNRCVLHNPVNDYQGFRRVMHRVTLAGDSRVSAFRRQFLRRRVAPEREHRARAKKRADGEKQKRPVPSDRGMDRRHQMDRHHRQRKPTQVCTVTMVPTCSASDSSTTLAENSPSWRRRKRPRRRRRQTAVPLGCRTASRR